MNFSSKSVRRKTDWSWGEIDRLTPFKRLTQEQAEVYIDRAKRQMSTPTDIGTVDNKGKSEIYRKAHYKKMGWKYNKKTTRL